MTETKQPEALRLASEISAAGRFANDETIVSAAVELRRLHAENEALRAQMDERDEDGATTEKSSADQPPQRTGSDAPSPVDRTVLAMLDAQHIDSRYAPRLALALECMVLDPTRWSESSMALLDKYRAEWDRANPMPPTFMGEPV